MAFLLFKEKAFLTIEMFKDFILLTFHYLSYKININGMQQNDLFQFPSKMVRLNYIYSFDMDIYS